MTRPLNGAPQRADTPSRSRKEAAKRLGIALTADYRRLLAARGEDEIQRAAIVLGDNFNNNLEFICWVLKEYGGMEQMPFQPQARPITKNVPPANDLPSLPANLTGMVPLGECTCPPLEHGMILRDKHMTSCPRFVPE